ncbi:Clp protease N-terminal domain-containing protein [Nonomuraea dietziae]|uniref:Clp protease N-terminal domain-containing protein n=1 Tax=Nonomuraea dietziae TaxID=65515 RepID=UPI0031DF916A
MNMFDTYLHTIITEGAVEAQRHGSPTVEAQHLLLAVAAQEGTAPQRLLASAGLDHQAVLAALDREFDHSLSAVGVSRASFGLSRSSTPVNRPPTMGATAKLALERGFAAGPPQEGPATGARAARDPSGRGRHGAEGPGPGRRRPYRPADPGPERHRRRRHRVSRHSPAPWPGHVGAGQEPGWNRFALSTQSGQTGRSPDRATASGVAGRKEPRAEKPGGRPVAGSTRNVTTSPGSKLNSRLHA